MNAITQRRIAKIFDRIEADGKLKEKPSALFIHNGEEPFIDYDFFYITDYPYGLFEGSALVATSDGSCTVIASPLEEPIARRFSNGIETIIQKPGQTAEAVAEKTFGYLSRKIVGVDFSKITQEEFYWLKKKIRPKAMVDISSSLQKTRAVKDNGEISRIEKATSIVSSVFSDIYRTVKKGMAESAVAASLNYAMEKKGSSGTAFETISSSGPNSAEPHYSSGRRKIQKGDNLLLDFGAKIKRYNSDMTRTLFCGRTPRPMKEIYDVVSRAQLEAIDAIAEGVEASDIDKVARKVIDSGHHKGRFTHGVGHSIGLAVHDGFGLNSRNHEPLEKNMVLTIEPGVYVQNAGGVRIEDDIVVTSRKAKVLTTATKEILEFD